MALGKITAELLPTFSGDGGGLPDAGDLNMARQCRPRQPTAGAIVQPLETHEAIVRIGDDMFTRDLLKSLASQKGKEGVYLRGDANVNYGLVIQVFSIMRNSGVTNIGLVAEPEPVAK